MLVGGGATVGEGEVGMVVDGGMVGVAVDGAVGVGAGV